jgi:predicted transcriptional regulator
MNDRQLNLHIAASETAGLDDMGQRFAAAWKRAELGGTDAQDHVTFLSLEAFQAAMSPRRLELMRALRREGPMSVRKLSQVLRRDYKSVHREVAMLVDAGLVDRLDVDKIAMRWDRALTQIDLAA